MADGEAGRLPAPAEFLRPGFVVVAALLAVGCGLIGAGFSFLVLTVERLAFGFTTGTLAEAITEITALHRFATVAVTGMVVAVLWFLLRRHGPAIPSPAQVAAGTRIPFRWMLADTVLQVVDVAAGASIGREGAPRQLGAQTGSDLADRFGLGADARRLLVGCGAGAGLAAIYNVPFGGALFTLEVMVGLAVLRRHRPGPVVGTALTALGTAWIATLIARIAVPDRPTYTFDAGVGDPRLVLVALVYGSVLGAAGYGFGALIDASARRAPTGRSILWTMPICYLLLAALAVPLPLVLGNGHALAENLFAGTVPLAVVALLVVAKPLATVLTVRAGATGGRLTPALSTGAAAGSALAGVGAAAWPVSVPAAAVLGAAAFLVGAMVAPLTAVALVIEFTGLAPIGWPLVLLTVAAATVTVTAIRRAAAARTRRPAG